MRLNSTQAALSSQKDPACACPKRYSTIVAIGLLAISSSSVVAQTWVLTSVPVQASRALASSADGSTLYAGGWGCPVFISTDSGATWAPTASPTAMWICVACSRSGTTVIAGANGGPAYSSTNSGASWDVLSAYVYSVATSADGTRLAAAGGDKLYISTNSGVTWTTYRPGCYLQAIASSADGARLVGGIYEAPIYISTNSGVSWSATTAPRKDWRYVTSSADGSKLAGMVDYYAGLHEELWISTNSGAAWAAVTPPSAKNWLSAAFTADGGRLVAVMDDTSVYNSLDAGATWTLSGAAGASGPTGDDPCRIIFSADGSKLAGGGGPGSVYGSVYTWRAIPALTIAISNQTAVLSWPVSSSAADFALQQSPNPANANWEHLLAAPTVVDQRWQAAFPAQGATMFYRLALH